MSAKALVRSARGILFVQEHDGYWDLPGGGIEHFEKPDQALRREIQEELGIEAHIVHEEPLRVWLLHDKQYNWPLLSLLYPTLLGAKDVERLSGPQTRLLSPAELSQIDLAPYLKPIHEELLRLCI